MQPNWKTAPLWASWWSVDSDGKAHFHQVRPVKGAGEWVYHLGADCKGSWNKKQFEQQGEVDDWTSTLTERPAPKHTAPAKRSRLFDLIRSG